MDNKNLQTKQNQIKTQFQPFIEEIQNFTKFKKYKNLEFDVLINMFNKVTNQEPNNK